MTTTTATLVIPDLPVPNRRLNPNAGTPQRTIARLRRDQRRDAGLVAYRAIGPDTPRPIFPAGVKVRIDAVVHWPGSRFPDFDNTVAMLKGTLDGITDGGAMADDKQARWVNIEFIAATVRSGGTMTLTLTPDERQP